MIIVIILIWIWYIKAEHPAFDVENIQYMRQRAKTGDLILFHALDNVNGLFIGAYYTHVGVVYVDSNGHQWLFEAFAPSGCYMVPGAATHGICLSDLVNRVSTYRGYVFYKELITPRNARQIAAFEELIDFALKNMWYDEAVLATFMDHMIYNAELTLGTNCGELTTLAMMAMGIARPKTNRIYFLHYVTGMSGYREPVYIFPQQFVF